jgi:hypothetical protein
MPFIHWETRSRQLDIEFFLLLKSLLGLLDEHKTKPSNSKIWKQLSMEDMKFLQDSLLKSYSVVSHIDISKIAKPWGLSPEDLEMFRMLSPKRKPPEIDVLKGKTLKSPKQVQEALRCCYDSAKDGDREKLLLDAYMEDRHPLHIRRTLDQSYYYMLKNTRARDGDQVVSRYGVKMGRKQPVVMMVDQLWLWILEGNKRVATLKEHSLT